MTNPTPAPSAFQCPFARQCWQRELFRWLATVLLAAVTGWVAGCAGRVSLKGWPPGIDLQAEWQDPHIGQTRTTLPDGTVIIAPAATLPAK